MRDESPGVSRLAMSGTWKTASPASSDTLILGEKTWPKGAAGEHRLP
jgi:hypothetical protein